MKWSVLTLFLLVGCVWSASAAPMDANLVGEWETYDGLCSPCTLRIPASGPVTFAQAGSAVEVIYAEGTPEQGIDVTLARGDTLDLQLTQSDWLVGFYTDWAQSRRNRPIAFRHK